MKKNRMMRSASALLVMVLLTTSVISGTFAKYVTTNKVEDTARVAKWGVTIDASGNLFGKNYLNGTTNTPTVDSTATNISVALGDTSDDKLVAPGTKSENGLSFGIKGTPEVDTKVSMEIVAKDIYLAEGTYGVMQQVTVNETNYATLVTEGLYTYADSAYTKVTGNTYTAGTYYQLAYTATVAAGGYYPVVYSWDGNTNLKKAADIAKAYAEKINSTSLSDADTTTAGVKYTVDKTYDSNTVLDTAIELDAETLTWEWAFGTAETEIGKAVVADSNDARDTILGDLMADVDDCDVVVCTVGNNIVTGVTELTISDKLVKNGETEVGCLETKFDIKITVEQVD